MNKWLIEHYSWEVVGLNAEFFSEYGDETADTDWDEYLEDKKLWRWYTCYSKEPMSFEESLQILRQLESAPDRLHYRMRNIETGEIIPGELFGG